MLRSLSYLEPLLLMILGGVAAADSRSALRVVLKAQIIAFLVVATVALLEFTRGVNPLIEIGAMSSGQTWFMDERLGFGSRLASTIGQPVYMGLYALVMTAVIDYYRQVFAASTASKAVLLLLMAVAILLVFLSGSRACQAGLLIYPLSYSVMRGAGRRMRGLIATYAVIAIAIPLMGGAFMKYWQASMSLDVAGSENANVLGRILLTVRMIGIFQQHPLLGVGPGGIQHSVFSGEASPYQGLEGMENQYAALLAEGGAVGLLGYLIFLGLLLRGLVRNAALGADATAVGFGRWLTTVFIVVLAVAATCTVLTSTVMSLLMTLAGMALVVQRWTIPTVRPALEGAYSPLMRESAP